MKRELLSIANASSLPPDYDAAKDLVELEKRNVRAAARAKYIKAALVTAALAGWWRNSCQLADNCQILSPIAVHKSLFA